MENNNQNYIGSVSLLKDSIETLIRDSERLETIAEYVRHSKYVDRETLLILLGFIPEENNK